MLADRLGEAMNENGRKDGVGKWQNRRTFSITTHTIPARELDDMALEAFRRLVNYGRVELFEDPQAIIEVAMDVAAELSTSSRQVASLSSKESANGETRRLAPEEVILRALVTLQPRQRKILKLRFFDRLTEAQIADQLSVTERVVKLALARIYLHFRTTLAPTQT